MAVSAKHKFAFIHVPKTGGSYLKTVLASLFEDLRKIGHAGILSAYEKQNYHIFAVVRNPYERFLSAWFYLKGGGNNIADQKDFEKWIGSKSFETFVASLQQKNSAKFKQLHFQTQLHYIAPYFSRIKFFYTPQDAIADLLARLDIKNSVIDETPKNESKAKQPVQITQQLADQIYEAYKEDFDAFGFARDSWKLLSRHVILPQIEGKTLGAFAKDLCGNRALCKNVLQPIASIPNETTLSTTAISHSPLPRRKINLDAQPADSPRRNKVVTQSQTKQRQPTTVPSFRRRQLQFFLNKQKHRK